MHRFLVTVGCNENLAWSTTVRRRLHTCGAVRAGKPQRQTADDLGIHPVTLSKWLKQDDIDRGVRPGVPMS